MSGFEVNSMEEETVIVYLRRKADNFTVRNHGSSNQWVFLWRARVG
jgi:hypothetical protein